MDSMLSSKTLRVWWSMNEPMAHGIWWLNGLSSLIHPLRSSQYGSPNCRKRCYILACRKDIIDPLSFMAMCHFAEHIAPHAHQGSASLTDCHSVLSLIPDFGRVNVAAVDAGETIKAINRYDSWFVTQQWNIIIINYRLIIINYHLMIHDSWFHDMMIWFDHMIWMNDMSIWQYSDNISTVRTMESWFMNHSPVVNRCVFPSCRIASVWRSLRQSQSESLVWLSLYGLWLYALTTGWFNSFISSPLFSDSAAVCVFLLPSFSFS